MTVQTLSDKMEFDHVIHVDWNGDVTDAPIDASLWAPDVHFIEDAPRGEDDILIDSRDDGWTALKGFTGQYSYNGAILHPSEFIGGGLETYILQNHGYYVTAVVEDFNDDDEG